MFNHNRIRERRMQLGITERKVEEVLGVSRPCLRSWEDGKTFPPADLLEKLVALLNDDIVYFFSGLDEQGQPLRESLRK